MEYSAEHALSTSRTYLHSGPRVCYLFSDRNMAAANAIAFTQPPMRQASKAPPTLPQEILNQIISTALCSPVHIILATEEVDEHVAAFREYRALINSLAMTSLSFLEQVRKTLASNISLMAEVHQWTDAYWTGRSCILTGGVCVGCCPAFDDQDAQARAFNKHARLKKVVATTERMLRRLQRIQRGDCVDRSDEGNPNNPAAFRHRRPRFELLSPAARNAVFKYFNYARFHNDSQRGPALVDVDAQASL